MLAVFIILAELLLLVASQTEVDVRCTKLFCEETLVETKCNSLPSGCNKTADGTIISGYYLDSPTVCNCCDYCLTELELGASCVKGLEGQPMTTSICGAGLTCSQTEFKCIPMNTPCIAEQGKFDTDKQNGVLGVARWRPLCDGEGNYMNVHCNPNSICYCIDPESGVRIFGEALYTSDRIPNEMTCKCSQDAWRASKFLGSDVEVAHCLSDGSFDELQCVDTKCACVNRKDATLDTTKSVHIIDLNEASLECFDPEEHTARKFEKPCEEEKYNKLMEKETLQEENFIILNLEFPNCTPDGHYARAQLRDGKKICVDPDGLQIENFESPTDTDCNCARTQWLLKKNGDSELPTCSEDGSYSPIQCWRGRCYCVDANGNQIKDDVDQTEAHTLTC